MPASVGHVAARFGDAAERTQRESLFLFLCASAVLPGFELPARSVPSRVRGEAGIITLSSGSVVMRLASAQ